jgi:hypothetical protein
MPANAQHARNRRKPLFDARQGLKCTATSLPHTMPANAQHAQLAGNAD